jgi:hypothetical protein
MPDPTIGAERAARRNDSRLDGVASRADLRRVGVEPDQVTAQLRAGRWQMIGTAVLLHNGAPSTPQYRRVALISCGPRSVLTSFTAAEEWGLRGWERDEVHVLAPAGTASPRLVGVRLHRSRDWSRVDISTGRRLHRLAPALVVAAAEFRMPRPACGLFAAAVQQRLLRPRDLAVALQAAPRARHRRALLAAVADIQQGAHALTEIDFARLCRRNGLPEPIRQAIRHEGFGRRRYLDVEWRLADGRIVAVEVDGALHLSARQWVDDQVRQNEVVLGGTIVLRFPSVLVREEPGLVIAQLRRALAC